MCCNFLCISYKLLHVTLSSELMHQSPSTVQSMFLFKSIYFLKRLLYTYIYRSGFPAVFYNGGELTHLT